MVVYMMEFFGDLPQKGLSGPKAFNTLKEALRFLEDTFPLEVDKKDGIETINLGHCPDNDNLWLDPEDDRILIWEINTYCNGTRNLNYEYDTPTVKICWHFSGWHWSHEANELPGGPLKQGKLPRDDYSLYEMATRE